MKASLWKYLGAQVICLSLGLSPIVALAQSSDVGQNLEACKAARESCDRSKLSATQLADAALAAHSRNVAN
jgi:hypothetical protein